MSHIPVYRCINPQPLGALALKTNEKRPRDWPSSSHSSPIATLRYLSKLHPFDLSVAPRLLDNTQRHGVLTPSING
jgi:hypothetical protein